MRFSGTLGERKAAAVSEYSFADLIPFWVSFGQAQSKLTASNSFTETFTYKLAEIMDDTGKIKFRIQRKDPKPNAKKYHIETVQDIFDATNMDNVDKFLEEFKIVLCSGYLLRVVSKNENPGEEIKLPSFTWIDD